MRPAAKWTALVLLDMVVVAAIGTAALWWPVPRALDPEAGVRGLDDGHWWHRSAAECVVRPPVLAAKDAVLSGREEVVGVEVGGRARAYLLAAFRFPSRHIVNDLIDGIPVSVAYCDARDCARVYTAPRGSPPLDITQAGLRDGQMVVRFAGVLYDHESACAIEVGPGHTNLPLEPLPATRTTWDEWRRLHPGTEVYTGPRGDDRLSGSRKGDGVFRHAGRGSLTAAPPAG
jgi:hypothetical protein